MLSSAWAVRRPSCWLQITKDRRGDKLDPFVSVAVSGSRSAPLFQVLAAVNPMALAYGHSPASGRSRNALTRSSISLQSLETFDLLIPDSPIACTRSSTAGSGRPRSRPPGLPRSAPSPSSCGLRETAGNSSLPQLRDAQLQRAEAGVERAVAVAVAPGAPLAAALMSAGAD